MKSKFTIILCITLLSFTLSFTDVIYAQNSAAESPATPATTPPLNQATPKEKPTDAAKLPKEKATVKKTRKPKADKAAVTGGR